MTTKAWHLQLATNLSNAGKRRLILFVREYITHNKNHATRFTAEAGSSSQAIPCCYVARCQKDEDGDVQAEMCSLISYNFILACLYVAPVYLAKATGRRRQGKFVENFSLSKSKLDPDSDPDCIGSGQVPDGEASVRKIVRLGCSEGGLPMDKG